MNRIGFCPKCQINPVEKIGKYGPLPRCAKCISQSIRGRYDRRNEKFHAGLINTHKNSKGERYPDRFIPKERKCDYCTETFIADSKSNGKPVCEKCISLWFEEKRKKKIIGVKQRYQKKSVEIKLTRIKAMCKRAGLSLDWYEKQAKICGICGTDKPGSKMGWCIDHDHKCCPYGTRQGCAKCIRGLLCNNCNRGLGYFMDNPKILYEAIRWIERHSHRIAHA